MVKSGDTLNGKGKTRVAGNGRMISAPFLRPVGANVCPAVANHTARPTAVGERHNLTIKHSGNEIAARQKR